MGATSERSLRTYLTAGWAAISLVPLASAISTVWARWVPVGDRGMIAALAVDSTTSDLPLVGMPTSLSAYAGETLHHPGPLGFWVLAAPARFLGTPGDGLILGSLAVAIASLATLAFLARQWENPAVEIGLLALVSAIIATLGGSVFHDPFNPYIGVLPLLACLVAAWGVLSGRHRQLLAFVVAGSFAAQVHLSYLAIVAALVAMVVASLLFDARRHRVGARPILVGLAAGLACWVAPLVDQLFGSGNLAAILTTRSTASTTGRRYGLRMLLENAAPIPGWLQGRASNGPVTDPGALRTGLAIIVLSTIAVAGARAVARRDRPLAALCAVSLVAAMVASWLSANIVTGQLQQETFLIYRLYWWPVGAALLAALVWSVASLVPKPNRVPVRPIALACAAFAVVVACLGIERFDPHTHELSPLFGEARVHAAAIADLVGDGGTVAIDFDPATGTDPVPNGLTTYLHTQGIIGQLRLEGVTVRLDPAERTDDVVLKSYRQDHPATGEEDADVYIRVGPSVVDAPPPEGYRVLSKYDPADPLSRYEDYDGPVIIPVQSVVYARESD